MVITHRRGQLEAFAEFLEKPAYACFKTQMGDYSCQMINIKDAVNRQIESRLILPSRYVDFFLYLFFCVYLCLFLNIGKINAQCAYNKKQHTHTHTKN